MKDAFNRIKGYVVFVYDKTHWFTDKEAWWIFRLGAILEAIGWTLLISAIIYRRFDLPLDDTFVTIAGRIHGMFFVCYFGAVLVTARSMGWGIWRFGGAVAMGFAPYTSLVFEKGMAFHRKKVPVYIEPPRNINDD